MGRGGADGVGPFNCCLDSDRTQYGTVCSFKSLTYLRLGHWVERYGGLWDYWYVACHILVLDVFSVHGSRDSAAEAAVPWSRPPLNEARCSGVVHGRGVESGEAWEGNILEQHHRDGIDPSRNRRFDGFLVEEML